MLKARAMQRSFLDADQIAESLIPADSFYRRFRELVWPLIRDEDFASLYCTSNGRPAISPALLAMALILQFHEDLSDRDMEAACRFDLRINTLWASPLMSGRLIILLLVTSAIVC